MPQDKVKPIELQTVNSNTLAPGSYTAITDDLEAACFSILIRNLSSEVVYISYDGTDDHDVIPVDGKLSIEFQINNQPNNEKALLAKGTKIYARSTTGTGFLSLSGWYQD